VEETMKPDQKHKMQAKKTDKAMGDLKSKKVDSRDAEQVRGGLTRAHDDESPKESSSIR
jgi:hypothetical protein